MTLSDDLIQKILPLRLLLLDVDGVLTDGSIIYTDKGDEIKVFCVKDGLGLRLLMDSGISVGIITGRRSPALQSRCKNLGIEILFEGVSDKLSILDALVRDNGFAYNEVAYIGDDLPDIPIMKKTGFPVAVADAAPETISHALYVTTALGGKGAVREISELILKAKDLWNRAIKRYV
jgi:3-deoxy-D-manno-octulosonate 8-phosphate phosphatase (KDO 8-P phosphatase)